MLPFKLAYKMSLKIAMLAIHSSPLGRLGARDTGGMSVYLLEIARELGNQGHKIDIFTRATNTNNMEIINPLPNVRIVYLDVTGTASLAPETLCEYTKNFAEAIIRFSEKEDISYVLIHSNYWVSGVVGKCLKSVWQCPHLITFHTLGTAKMAALANHHETEKRLREEASLLKHCDGIIVATEAEKEFLVTNKMAKPKKIHVVPAGVNLDHFKPNVLHQYQPSQNVNQENFVLLYVGRFDAMKGMELLLSSISLLPLNPAVNLIMIGGDGPGTVNHEYIITLARQLGISKRINLIGSIDHRLMSRYYQKADAVVVTSYYESYGLVTLEALATGTPVVSTNVGVAPQVIRPGVNGYLVNGRDSRMLAETITRTLRLSRQQNPVSISKSVAGFGWSRTARLLLSLYNDPISKNKPVMTCSCHG
jgi:D-inositol-3-phosphate glycosyltransferase